jgi:GNAT superfamily N-acetyltransferase
VIVREARPEDEAGLAALAVASPDGGAVAFTPEQYVPAREIAREHEISECFVAEVDGMVAGTGQLDIGTCRFEGDDVRYALLSTLRVHPDYRRRGIAARLTDWRLQRAVELAGHDVVVVAYIQAGNTVSVGNARRWATQVGGRIIVTPVPMRRRPPRPRAGLTVRPAADAELAEIAATIDAHYAGHDFARRWNQLRLTGWLAVSPFPDPVNHYLVVTDRSGRLLAGLGLHEEGRLSSLVIGHLRPGSGLRRAAAHRAARWPDAQPHRGQGLVRARPPRRGALPVAGDTLGVAQHRHQPAADPRPPQSRPRRHRRPALAADNHRNRRRALTQADAPADHRRAALRRSDGGTSRDGLSHSVFQRLPRACNVPARASKRGISASRELHQEEVTVG